MMELLAPAAPSGELEELHTHLMRDMRAKVCQEVDGVRIYTDVPAFLEGQFNTSEKLETFAIAMQDLHDKVVRVLQVVPEDNPLEVVPERPPPKGPNGELFSCRIRLWQMGFAEGASIKGPSNFCDILDIVTRNFFNGNNTEQYPIEVLFYLMGQRPGDTIANFHVGLSIGFGTVLACFLLVKWCIDENWYADKFEVFQKMAPKLLRTLRLTATYDPADTMAEQLQKSIGGKIAAANRQRPTTLQLLYSFSRQIAEMSATGSRQCRGDLLVQVVKSYNGKERVRTCKIHIDEINVMRFLQRRSDAFVKILKVIWGNDKTANTAAPMSLLASPFLDESRPLPVTERENATWATILTPSEEKFVTWIERVQGRYNQKIEEQLSKGKVPNLRNYSHMYRDQEPEMVWRISCVFTAALPTMKAAMTESRIQEITAQFKRGVLDNDMLDKARCLSPAFLYEDLRFIRSSQDDAGIPNQSDGDALSNAEKQKVHADFKYMELRLKSEQASWRRHLLALKTYDDTTQAELTQFRERAHDLRSIAINAHAEALYQAESLVSLKYLPPFFEKALATFAEQPQSRVQAEDVVRINMFNLPMMGQWFSRQLNDIAELIRLECAHHPTNTLCLVMLPNTTKWGQGMESNATRDDNIEAACKDVVAKLKEPHNDLLIQDVFALFRHDTMYSKTREMRAVFLMAVSDMKAADGKSLQSRFQSSVAWKRKAVIEALPVFNRQDFRDWTKVATPFDHGNPDASVDRKQWFSGSGFLAGIITASLNGLGLTAAQCCHVRDWTLYDDQLAVAVMELNSRSDKHLPMFAYAGGTFPDLGGLTIAENVKEAIHTSMLAMVVAGTYHIPGHREPGPEPKAASRPVFKTDDMNLTCARANNELPILQSVHDVWDSVTMLKKEWDNLVKTHNDEFNPSGVPWKARRPAEVPLQNLPEAEAMRIQSPEGAPQSMDELVGLPKRARGSEVRRAQAHVSCTQS